MMIDPATGHAANCLHGLVERLRMTVEGTDCARCVAFGLMEVVRRIFEYGPEPMPEELYDDLQDTIAECDLAMLALDHTCPTEDDDDDDEDEEETKTTD